jgi:hypothetical protein
MEHGGLAVAVGNRAGLVQQQHVHVAGYFHRLAGFGEDIRRQRTVHARYADSRKQATDRGGNQAHQQCDQQEWRDLHADKGADGRQRGHDDEEGQRHRRQQHRECDFVGRLLPVGAFDQRDHAVEEAVAGFGGDADDDLVGQHLGPADHTGTIGAGLAQHRCGFAGDRGFVDRGQALDDLAVGGDLLAGADDHGVARAQVSGRNLRFAAACNLLAGDQVLACATQRRSLSTPARFGDGLGEVAEQHGDEQDRGDRPTEAGRCRSRQRDQCRQRGSDQHDRHHRALDQMARRQLEEGIAHRRAHCRGVHQGGRTRGFVLESDFAHFIALSGPGRSTTNGRQSVPAPARG